MVTCTGNEEHLLLEWYYVMASLRSKVKHCENTACDDCNEGPGECIDERMNGCRTEARQEGRHEARTEGMKEYTQSGKSVHRLFETQITMGRRAFGKSEKSVQFNVN